MSILVKNISHIFSKGLPNEIMALDHVSFEVEDGEWLGIIGHTGSGKSTLIQHLNGLLQPDSGRVVVNGIDLAEKKLRRAVRQEVGMVFQYAEYQLFEETVEKDVAFGPKNMGITDEKELQGFVKKAMQQVGLSYEEFASQSPFELSGGEKRRVALAGILAMQPSILILDEPMAGLDPVGRKDILSYLQDLHKNGMTIIMVSHSMDDIAELTDRVLVMHQGENILLDTPSAVFLQEQQLTAIGLGIPKIVKIANQMREKGVPVPFDIIKKDALKSWILEYSRRDH